MTCQKVHVDSDVIQAFGGQGKQAFVDTHHEVEIDCNIIFTFLTSFEARSFIELRVLDYCVAFWAIEIGNWRSQKHVWTWRQICRCSAHWAAAFAR